MTPKILVLYYSVRGGTKQLAQTLAEGLLQAGADPILRTVPRVQSVLDHQPALEAPSDIETFYVTEKDIEECDGLIIGSPTRFGNMAAPLKFFIDKLSTQWMNNELVGKPSGAFCSTASLHGGQEATLLSMSIPLMHLGTVFVSLPYTSYSLGQTKSGGTPYGPSHWSEHQKREKLSDEEIKICHDYAQHFAQIAKKLMSNS